MSDGPICVEGCGADLSREQHHADCPIFDIEEWADDVSVYPKEAENGG